MPEQQKGEVDGQECHYFCFRRRKGVFGGVMRQTIRRNLVISHSDWRLLALISGISRTSAFNVSGIAAITVLVTAVVLVHE